MKRPSDRRLARLPKWAQAYILALERYPVVTVPVEPYWQTPDHALVLYCADALQWLDIAAPASIDAIITDPSYASGGFTEAQRKLTPGQGLRSSTRKTKGWFSGDNMGTSGLAWLLRSLAVAAFHTLRPTGSLLIFTDWRQEHTLVPAIESAGLRYQNLVAWDKGSPGLGRAFRPQHELIMHFTHGPSAAYHDKAAGNILPAKRPSSTKRRHPTQKPVDLLARMIRVVAPPGGLILDPFAGSCATLAAARATGRRAIGIERDPDTCRTAAEYLTAYVADMPGPVDPDQLPLLQGGTA